MEVGELLDVLKEKEDNDSPFLIINRDAGLTGYLRDSQSWDDGDLIFYPLRNSQSWEDKAEDALSAPEIIEILQDKEGTVNLQNYCTKARYTITFAEWEELLEDEDFMALYLEDNTPQRLRSFNIVDTETGEADHE